MCQFINVLPVLRGPVKTPVLPHVLALTGGGDNIASGPQRPGYFGWDIGVRLDV